MLKTVSTANGLVSPTFSGDVTLSTGNLVIGTSGKGIDFSATPGTGTSELFDDYEEGTWTPIFEPSAGAFGAITYGLQTGTYTKIGNVVYISGQLLTDAVTIGTASGELFVAGLPFGAATFGPLAVSWSQDWSLANNPNSVSVRGGTLTNCRIFARSLANGPNVPLDPTALQNGVAKNYIQFGGCYIAS